MRLVRPYVFLAITAALAISCSDQAPGTEAITIDDLVGSWTVSSHVFTSNADPGQTFDLIANGGETRVTVLAGGGARTWVTIGTFADEWDAQLTMTGNTLTSTPVEVSRGVGHSTFSLNGNVLTLTDTDSEFDFTLADAAEVAATEVVVLIRQ